MANPANSNPTQAAFQERAKAEQAKAKEAKDKILAIHKEREKWKPTPTQEENDLAVMGQNKLEKEPDGSPEEPSTLEGQTRHMESHGGAPYSTRHMGAPQQTRHHT